MVRATLHWSNFKTLSLTRSIAQYRLLLILAAYFNCVLSIFLSIDLLVRNIAVSLMVPMLRVCVLQSMQS